MCALLAHIVVFPVSVHPFISLLRPMHRHQILPHPLSSVAQSLHFFFFLLYAFFSFSLFDVANRPFLHACLFDFSRRTYPRCHWLKKVLLFDPLKSRKQTTTNHANKGGKRERTIVQKDSASLLTNVLNCSRTRNGSTGKGWESKEHERKKDEEGRRSNWRAKK
ncbi:MAG: hypothetical protein J3R72DRAFT_127856 [Linnemannia gamsii]|nr:MAG: hypothetical protein J3R72DRAFT_127856 [Linnemannia gamsii]